MRLTGQYESIAQVEQTVIAWSSGAPVYVSDVAEVVETHKEPVTFVRSRGQQVLALNFQKEVGANVITPDAPPQDGRQRFTAWNCPPR